MSKLSEMDFIPDWSSDNVKLHCDEYEKLNLGIDSLVPSAQSFGVRDTVCDKCLEKDILGRGGGILFQCHHQFCLQCARLMLPHSCTCYKVLGCKVCSLMPDEIVAGNTAVHPIVRMSKKQKVWALRTKVRQQRVQRELSVCLSHLRIAVCHGTLLTNFKADKLGIPDVNVKEIVAH